MSTLRVTPIAVARKIIYLPVPKIRDQPDAALVSNDPVLATTPYLYV